MRGLLGHEAACLAADGGRIVCVREGVVDHLRGRGEAAAAVAVKALASSLLLARAYVQTLTSSNVNEPLVPANSGGIRKSASRTSASGSVALGTLPVWVTS